jgi:hypothetical protein
MSNKLAQKEKVKLVHKVKGTGQVVIRVKYNRRLAWMSQDGKIWPSELVEYGPEVK